MKNRIVSLMLSAAIFTTNPLFAMEPLPEEEKKIILHKPCSLCTPVLMPDANIESGKGILSIFPDDKIIINVLHNTPYNTILALFSTSKIMNFFCQSPVIWERIAAKENINVNSNCCIIDQVKESLALFGNINKNYKVTISEPQPFKQEPYSCLIGKSWLFPIGKSKFQIVSTTTPDHLEVLSGDISITFS